jgi:chromosome segregation protein
VYLKKLSLQGFKSFPNRTNFEFGTGVTAVVGPNGSGKSNVSDAIRWVLGEQSIRMLRAKKAEDVIFSGTSERAQVGMAEVLLTLDNEDRWLPLDFAEVEIGRRVYRNGDSEYLLNGSRVRLKDIVDLLMRGDVGQNSYTIMGQGLVDEVLSMSPEERRSFVDEAADVKRFRTKIKEAQDRLKATRDNMARVDLIVKEIEPRLSQLERQAGRATEHAELSARLTSLLRRYYTARWADAQNEVVRARAVLDQRIAEHAEAEERVAQLREQVQRLGEEIRRRREAIARRDSRSIEMEQQVAQTEQAISLERERHGMVAARREELRLEIDALESERISLGNTDIDEGRRGIAMKDEVDAARASLQQCRSVLEQAEREYSSLRARAQEIREIVEADERRRATAEADAAAAGQRIQELDREEGQTVVRRRQLLVELKNFGQQFKQVLVTVEAAQARLDGAREEAEDARRRLEQVQDEVRRYESAGQADYRELDRLEGRLEALQHVQAEHEGVASGTRNVLIMGQALIDGVEPGSLGEPPEIHGVLGLLSRQLRVPAGLEAAINAALEHRLHAVIVEHEEEALKAISLLQRRNGGRALFLPMDSLRNVYPLNLQKERGVVGVASKLVKCDGKFRSLVDTLLGRVIIVEDMPTAAKMIRRSLGSVVTTDGTFIDPTGVISGGAVSSDEGVFVRQNELVELPRRIAELRERVDVSERQLENGRTAIEQLIHVAREADDRYDQIRKSGDDGRLELERERDRLHRLRREMDTVYSKQADIARERDGCLQLIESSRKMLQQVEERSAARVEEQAAHEAELAAATERREAALRELSDASSRLASFEGEHKALEMLREQHERALERITSQLNARRLQERNLDLEGSVIEERLGKLARQLEALRLEQSQHVDDAAPDHDELHRFENRERQVQEELDQAREDFLRIERARLDGEAELNRGRETVEAIRVEMEREGLAPDRDGNVVPIEDAMVSEDMFQPEDQSTILRGSGDVDIEQLRREIEETRRQIRRLGPINAEAPEDYRESKERYDFLRTQMDDLTEAEAQLNGAIAELSGEINVRFNTTFERVNEAFGEYFTAFFGGGKARLMLANPDEPAESGIDIDAQPPGKRINSLSLLSGGERSLTAVALLFALLSVNPAPFCVLDEVDAALDEANVGRFTASLRKLSEKTQFLAVTHNRRTVEAADAIYGISMGRDGISKVLSLRLEDIEKDASRLGQ